MAYNFVAEDRDQLYLLPVSVAEWLPEEHLAYFVLDAVEEMDLSAFYAGYRGDGWGGAARHPKTMVALLLYAYCVGVRSSRGDRAGLPDRCGVSGGLRQRRSGPHDDRPVPSAP